MNHKEDTPDAASKGHVHHGSSGRVVKDPVCGMDVDPAVAVHRYEHNGQSYYFCSPPCLERFRAEPTKYLAHPLDHHVPPLSSSDAQSQLVDRSHGYLCPMHLEVHQQGPGSCPKCGMALDPVTSIAPTTRTEYVCPMHPQIVRAEPGSCPICGMALEPRTVTGEEETNPELVDM